MKRRKVDAASSPDKRALAVLALMRPPADNMSMRTTTPIRLRRLARAAAAASALVVSACGGSDTSPVRTLDGPQPLVVAHRGASGDLPEETLEACQMAIDIGADGIEPDVISTKDGVLIVRHDQPLSITPHCQPPRVRGPQGHPVGRRRHGGFRRVGERFQVGRNPDAGRDPATGRLAAAEQQPVQGGDAAAGDRPREGAKHRQASHDQRRP